MESVLVVGRIKPSSRNEAERALRFGLAEPLSPELTRQSVYRQGETIALLLEGPGAERCLLGLLAEDGGTLPRLIDCFEEVPLVPREVARVGGLRARSGGGRGAERPGPERRPAA